MRRKNCFKEEFNATTRSRRPGNCWRRIVLPKPCGRCKKRQSNIPIERPEHFAVIAQEKVDQITAEKERAEAEARAQAAAIQQVTNSARELFDRGQINDSLKLLADAHLKYPQSQEIRSAIASAQEELARQRAERERVERERAERERLAREQAERERLAREQAERERAEQERLAKERAAQEQAELERVAREKAERERAEQQRLAREKAAKEQAERERLAREKAEREHAEQERLAKERAAKEQAERERVTREKAERERVERERLAKERAEQERLAKERAAKEQAERERVTREKAERERVERERLAKERAEIERVAKEKAAIEQAEREKAAREKAERERAEQERLAKEKAAKEQAERERLAKEQAEREKVAREKAERERIEREKAAKEQAERERGRREAWLQQEIQKGQALVDGGHAPEAVRSLEAALRDRPDAKQLQNLLIAARALLDKQQQEQRRREQEAREAELRRKQEEEFVAAALKNAQKALRSRLYDDAIAILTEALQKTKSPKLEELLQAASNEKAEYGRQQQIQKISAELTAILAGPGYQDSVKFLDEKLRESPWNELKSLRAEALQVLARREAEIESILGEIKTLLETALFSEALKRAENVPAYFRSDDRYVAYLEAARQASDQLNVALGTYDESIGRLEGLTSLAELCEAKPPYENVDPNLASNPEWKVRTEKWEQKLAKQIADAAGKYLEDARQIVNSASDAELANARGVLQAPQLSAAIALLGASKPGKKLESQHLELCRRLDGLIAAAEARAAAKTRRDQDLKSLASLEQELGQATEEAGKAALANRAEEIARANPGDREIRHRIDSILTALGRRKAPARATPATGDATESSSRLSLAGLPAALESRQTQVALALALLALIAGGVFAVRHFTTAPQATVSVTFSKDPATGALKVDGQLVPNCIGSCNLNLKPGPHNIILEQSGFTSISEGITIGTAANQTFPLRLAPIPVARATPASLAIFGPKDGGLNGARVLLDGQEQGSLTPGVLPLESLTVGPHELTISREALVLRLPFQVTEEGGLKLAGAQGMDEYAVVVAFREASHLTLLCRCPGAKVLDKGKVLRPMDGGQYQIADRGKSKHELTIALQGKRGEPIGRHTVDEASATYGVIFLDTLLPVPATPPY